MDKQRGSRKKNHRIETEEKGILKFLVVYRIMPNLIMNANSSPAEIMFARKIHSIFERILRSQKKKSYTKINEKVKTYKEGDKIFFRNYCAGKSYWESGIITKRNRE